VLSRHVGQVGVTTRGSGLDGEDLRACSGAV
jgi:hypothetical protein